MNVIGPDISFYQDDNNTPQGVNFVVMRSETPYVIVRVGQNTWIDSDFQYNYSESKKVGLRRGTYWYYDSRSSPISQANLFASALDQDLGELPVFLDLEESYGGSYSGWSNWKKFLEQLKSLLPGKEIGIYTAYYYFKDNVPDSEKEYFHQYPLWIANYGTSKPAIPAPWGPDEWLFWQYQSNEMNLAGPKYGVESDGIDLNYFNGDMTAFDIRFPPVATPPVYEVSINTHDGVIVHKIRRFSTDCIVHVIDLNKVKVKLTVPFETIPASVDKYSSQLGFNGGGWGLWPNPSEPNEYLIIEGVVKQAKSFDGRPCMELTKDNKIVFHTKQPSFTTSWNVFGFDRMIATNGVYNSAITNNTPDPRTVYGRDSSGKLVVLVCEGRSSNQKGLTFKEVWSVMKEFGVTDCGNADGGYSSAAVNTYFTPKLMNKTYLVDNRKTVHQVLFYAEGEVAPPEPPPTGGTMDTYEVLVAVRPRSQPTMTTNDSDPNIPVGTRFDSDTTQVDEITSTHPVMVKIMTGPWTGKWVPLVYLNVEYTRKIATAPSPDGPSFTLKVQGYKEVSGVLEQE